MAEVSIFFSGLMFAFVLWLIFHRPAERQDPDALRLCEQTGGHHDWSKWEDLMTDSDGWLLQIRKCSNCGLANEAKIVPVLVPFRALPKQTN
jgi:hypothetical protein